MSQRGKFIKKIAFAKRPVEEKTKFLKNGEVKVKRSCHRRGRCFALFFGLRLPLLQAFQQLSHAFFIVYNLTAGRVNLKLLKMKKVMFTALALGLCITANVMAQVPSYVPTNGLVGYWPFNGNANDESGNGNNGTVNGATLTTDRFGNANKAYSFDGVDDFIESLNPLADLSSDFTISCYANINTWQGGLFVHVGIDQNSFPRDGFGIGYGSSQAVLSGQNYLGLLSNISWYQSGYQFNNLSIWYHTVVSRNNNILNYYVNGELVGSSTISAIVPPSNALFFGSGASLYANFNGKLDDIGIWNRALNQQEITDLYNETNLGIDNLLTDVLKIYPNPSNDYITINVGNLTIYNDYSIKIEDVHGQQVFQSAINQAQFYVDLSTWSGNGLYFVHLIDAQGNTVTVRKIVLQ